MFSPDLFLERAVKSSSPPDEKPFPPAPDPGEAPDPSAHNKGTNAKKGLQVSTGTESASLSENHKRNSGKPRQNFGKPQLVVKLATNKVTDKNLSRETASRRGRGRPPQKEKGNEVSHQEENGDVEDEVSGDPDTNAERKEMGRGRPSRRKFVWNLTLVKRRGRNSKKSLVENLGRRSLRGNGRNAESGEPPESAAMEELLIDQNASSVCVKPVAEHEEKQENAVSLDGNESTPVPQASSPHSPKQSPRALKRRRSLFGYRRKPEQELKKAQSPGENRIPRKRRRLVCYTYEAVESPVNQELKQEPPEQAPSQQVLADSAISGRPSRVIRVPKRFMDDEGMSGLLGKKSGQPENPEDEYRSDAEETNLSQTPRLGSKQKGASKRTECDEDDNSGSNNDENLFGKSVAWKPTGLTGGPRKKVGRPAYDATPLKIYERLKMLTASLAQRKEQRMASVRSKALGEKVECENPDADEAPGSRELRKWGSSDIKIGDLNCPGVVHKVAVHADDQAIGQSVLSSVERLEPKADGKEYERLLSLSC